MQLIRRRNGATCKSCLISVFCATFAPKVDVMCNFLVGEGMECTCLKPRFNTWAWHYPVLAPLKKIQSEPFRQICKKNRCLRAGGGLVEQSCQPCILAEDMQHVIVGKSQCKLHLLIHKINWLIASICQHQNS